MTDDARPYMEDWANIFPISLACQCVYSDGPGQDCPKHGDVELFAEWVQHHQFALSNMARVVNNVAKLADELSRGSERDRQISLHLFSVIAENFNLAPAPNPWDSPPTVPF